MDDSIDPVLLEGDDLREVLAGHDIGALYRALNASGLSQRRIAQLTGQSQSEVSEIVKGTRQVDNYRVLERIAEGLGIPREYMGLSYGRDGTYSEGVTLAEPEEADAMLRRHLLALGGITLAGAPVATLGSLLPEMPWPGSVPLPARLSTVHVTQIRDLTRRLDRALLARGSTPEVSTATAAWAMRLLEVPADEPVKRVLLSALAELHVHAGWAGFDAGHYRRSAYHYGRALETGDRSPEQLLPGTRSELRRAGHCGGGPPERRPEDAAMRAGESLGTPTGDGPRRGGHRRGFSDGGRGVRHDGLRNRAGCARTPQGR